MAKYKICPSCGAHNLPTLFECNECEADLTGVRVTDEASESIEQEDNNNIKAQSEVQLVRICDCGASNPPQARKCQACGEDIFDIVPINAKELKPKFILSSIDGSYCYELTNPFATIGREQEMKEYLMDKPFVSRTHAKLSIVNNEMYITNLSKTNYTFVNNQKLTESEPHHLKDGDEIGLGGMVINECRQEEAAYFVVRIGTCI